MQADALAESRRLLYVGLTRARDMNVLSSFVRMSGPGRGWVEEIPGAAQLLFGATETLVLPGGQLVARFTKVWSREDCAAEPPAQAPQDRHWFVHRPRAPSPSPSGSRPRSAIELTLLPTNICGRCRCNNETSIFEQGQQR